jgi:hypothetical protein
MATRLLRIFAPDAVVGDLIEAFRSDGRSRWWFWRQVAGCICAQMLGDFREHPVLMIRGIAFGHLFVWATAGYVMFDLLHYDEWLFSRGLVRWPYLHGYGLPGWFVWPATGVLTAVSGWIVARSHPRVRPGLVLIYALSVGCVTVGFGIWRLAHPLHPDSSAYLIGFRESIPLAVAALAGGMIGLDRTSRSRRVYE